MRRILFSLAFLFAFPLAFFARMQEKIDLAVIQQIKNEAFRNTQVMEHAFYLSEVYGPRLTGAPNYRAAGDWAADYFRKIGLSNVGQEKFPSREGWSFDRFYVRMAAPTSATLIGVPLAWSSGTEGSVQGEAMRAEFPSGPYPEDLKKFADTYGAKLRGKILMFQPPVELKLQTAALARRASDQDLFDLSFVEIPVPQPPPPPRTRPRVSPAEEAVWMKQFAEFLEEQGVTAILSARQGPINDGGTVSAGPAFGGRNFPPQIVLAAEHYNRILRLITRNIPVRIELELAVRFYENTQDSFNVIAEIPRARKKDEVVMIGAHLDSWHGGTGATDNAAGCAIMIEAMRILKKREFDVSQAKNQPVPEPRSGRGRD